MRKIIIFLTAVAFLACSCSRREDYVPQTPDSDLKTASLTVRVSTGGTKASSDDPSVTESEDRIHDIQVLVFSENGKLDAYACEKQSRVLSLACSSGQKSIYAVVNAGRDLSDVSSLSALEAQESLLTDNNRESFVMVGSSKVTLPDTEIIDIDIKKIASRVVVRKITNGMQGALASVPVRLDAVYLINVAGRQKSIIRASESLSADDVWLNKSAYRKEGGEMTFRTLGEKTTVSGDTFSQSSYLYAYPNPTKEERSVRDGWQPRYTRLVIETTIAGARYYYPIPISQMQGNKSYEFENIVLSKLGSPVPDGELETGSVEFRLGLRDWTRVLLSGEGESDGTWSL